jgi:hypothetical protein
MGGAYVTPDTVGRMTVPFWWSVVAQVLTVAVALGVVYLNNKRQEEREHKAWLRDRRAQTYERLFAWFQRFQEDGRRPHVAALDQIVDEILPAAMLYLPNEVAETIFRIEAIFHDADLKPEERGTSITLHFVRLRKLARKDLRTD